MKTKMPNNNRYQKKEWERELRQVFHQMPSTTNDVHLQATILLAQKEARLKQRRTPISFTRFLIKQIRLIGWKLWTLEGIAMFIVSRLLTRFYGFFLTPRQLMRLMACLSVLIFMTALPLLYRSVRYRMQEVETASRFSGVKLLSARLIVIGIGDVCMLTGIFLSPLLKTVLSADSIFFCLCFPFLLAGGGCLYLLGHFPPAQFFTGSLLLCSFLIMLFGLLPGPYPIMDQPSLIAVRAVLCALLLIFCVQQLHYLITVSSFEEMQLN